VEVGLAAGSLEVQLVTSVVLNDVVEGELVDSEVR